MRPASFIGWSCFAAAALASQAKDLFVDSTENRFARLNLSVRAEKVVHRGEPLLLLRIQASDYRAIDKAIGSTDSISLKDKGLAFLPMKVSCEKAVMLNNGKTYEPHASSLCSETVKLANAQAAPLFVAFKYPGKGSASVMVPVTVMEPDPPVAISIRPGPAYTQPRVTEALLGFHELSARVQID